MINKEEKEETYHIAGFGWRLIAYLLDSFILGVFTSIFINPLLSMAGVKLPNMTIEDIFNVQRSSPIFSPVEILGITWTDFLIIQGASVLVFWLYFSLMESSKKQATLGKLAFGMIVTDTEGAQISFARASARTLGKYISGLIFFIGYIMAAFTENNQALHDKMASTLVLKKDNVILQPD